MRAVMQRNENIEKRLAPFLVYLIAFFLAWIGWVLFVYPRLVILGETTLEYAAANISIRLLIWVLPVFLYLRFIDAVEPFKYLKLAQNWKRGVLIGLGLTVLNFVGLTLRFGWPHPSAHSVTWNSILSTSLFIGFVEEIPFRGFILQKLEERFSFWMANFISSVLFLGIHIPGWITLHMLKPGPVVFVFAFGVLMAVVFRYSKGLWAPIVSHSLNDCLSAVIFRA